VAEGAPRWPDRAFDELAGVLRTLVELAPDGVRVAFHPHTATWVEAPDEVDALAERLPSTGAGLCLDVGHYLVGGGDPVEAIGRYRDLITHVHVKDVDRAVLTRLRAGEIDGFGAAVRERIFTEPGNGVLDLAGVLGALDRIGYARWLMVEQDSSWLPPAEAAMVGRRVVEFARRIVLAERVG
jgi:inosose dehydratase